METKPTPDRDEQQTPAPASPKKRKHLIKTPWLRIPLKVLMWVVIALLILPVVIYIPPVQTALKDLACSIVKKQTGLEIGVEKLRIRFPLDVSLKGVTVVEATGDTMVRAREAIADVRFLPLLRLDLKLNKLSLEDGYYRMVSPDSSMILKVKAAHLEADNLSSFNIAKSQLLLNKVRLSDGDVQLYMDVWKQKPTPADTTATPFYIKANDIKIKNITFGMSMLPLIDTLFVDAKNLSLKRGVIDLAKNKITLGNAMVANGAVTYLTPTPEYIAAHPAPEPVESDSPPMVIVGDSLCLRNFQALYAIKGATPLPGFDPSYIQASGINIDLHGFYNEQSTVRLPITSMTATERCGLQVSDGSGLIAVDAIGLQLKDMRVTTPYSQLQATADIPFEMMELRPEAEMSMDANGRLGTPDIEAFMPALKTFIAPLPKGLPVELDLMANGSLASLDIYTLRLAMPSVFELNADGWVGNVLDMDKLSADISFDGKLSNPNVAERIAGIDIQLPTMTLDGTAQIGNGLYAADFELLSFAGDIAALGKVHMNAETYHADVQITDFDVATFLPDMGIGHVTASLQAEGAGFNPERAGAHTDISAKISRLEYLGYSYEPITAEATLEDGVFGLTLASSDPKLNLMLEGKGTISEDLYTFDINAFIHHLDLQALHISPDGINSGNADIRIKGTASPARWLYDVDMSLANVDWQVGESIFALPAPVTADFIATAESVDCNIDSDLTELRFSSPSGLQSLVEKFTVASDTIARQIERRNLAVDEFQPLLPKFSLRLNAGGAGLLDQLLGPSGVMVDTVSASIHNDSIFRANVDVLGIMTSAMNVDTLTLALNQRNKMLDYRIHMGNAPGTLDEFADVGIIGYLGGNRASLSLTQRNIKGEMGYRLGATAALMDSTVTLHFTPLRATIAYRPWIFNADNYIDYSFNNKIEANLLAFSQESSVLAKTEENEDGDTQLHLALTNIHIQDFLQMSLFAPPIKGDLNADAKVVYKNGRFLGNGTLNLLDFYYARQRVGSFDLDFKAGYNLNGNVGASVSLLIDKKKAVTARGYMLAVPRDSVSPNAFELTLTEFPLSIANPFLGKDVAQVSGALNGELKMTGQFSSPLLNGQLSCQDVNVRIPMMASDLRFSENPIIVKDNLLDFNSFSVYGANNNPLVLNGYVDARKLTDVLLNISLQGQNFQLVGNDQRARSEIYGKLFLDLDATAKGPLRHFDVNGRLTVLKNTDVTYSIPAATAMAAQTGAQAEGVVKFVNFADTIQVAKADSISSAISMRINATLTLQPGMQVAVKGFSSNATDKVNLQPSGTLTYSQSYMGDMRLNGQLNLGEGSASYTIPISGQKKFTIQPSSYVLWNGDIMNPTINLHAVDRMKTNVTNNNQSRLIDFDISLAVTNTLSAPKILFDLSTDDDITIQNELQSMSPDQRSAQAMQLLAYGQYTGPGTKTNTGDLANNMLYGFLESTLNNWAAKTIRGVDLSFGISQFENGTNGQNSSAMSYSYQVSKSLFDNRFKIVVGGNYTTDASADENFSQNLINDISFEYMLRQTQNMSMYVKLFRHTGFESILEGEVTQTGAGFVLNRRISDLRQLFRFRRRKRTSVQALPDSTSIPVKAEVTPDSISSTPPQQ